MNAERVGYSSEDAFTVLHDAFLAGGALIQVPAGVVVEDPMLVLHWCEGDGRASFPHTVVSLGENAEATVLDRFGSPETDHFVDAVTELLGEATLGAQLETTPVELGYAVHAHPTLSEAMKEAALAINGEAIHFYSSQRE